MRLASAALSACSCLISPMNGMEHSERHLEIAMTLEETLQFGGEHYFRLRP